MAKPLKSTLKSYYAQVSKLPWRNITRQVRIGFNIARAMSEKLPNKGDGPIKVAAAVLTTVDEVSGVLFPARGSPKALFLAARNLNALDNQSFVDLFFDTELKKDFLISEYRISDYEAVTEAKHRKLGTLYFFKSVYAEKYDSRFYIDKNSDIGDMLADIWATYDGRMHVAVVPGAFGVSKTTFTRFDSLDNPLFGEASARMESTLTDHRRYMARGRFRSYMFFGPPGSGKSTFACKMAEKLGERTLKMDATSLMHASYQDVAFLLNNLRPDFVLIDDIDKADIKTVIPTLLDIIARFKSGEEKATLMLTSNSVDTFDPGLLRPGRIDTWLEFKAPDAKERRFVLEQMGVPSEHLDPLVLESEGLTQDYLREAAEALEMFDMEKVVATMRLKRKFLGKMEKAKAKSDKVVEGQPAGDIDVFLNGHAKAPD